MSAQQVSLVDQLPLNKGVRLLAHNEDGLVALEKPAGALSHPNASDEKERSLLDADYNEQQECYSWKDELGNEQKAWLINRLDSPTSGVILVGTNLEISETIKRVFASHKITKTYYALVRGVPSIPSGVWADKLRKSVQRGKRFIKDALRVSAKTRYQVVKSPPGGLPIALLKLMPVTGRTHQLRVQCKKHGFPIIGDRTYGSFSFNREVYSLTDTKRMMLHSAQTIVDYSFKGKLRSFEAESPLPKPFNDVLGFRSGLNLSRPRPTKKLSLKGRRFKS